MIKKTSGFQLVLIILISLLAGYYFGVNKVSLDWTNYKPELTVLSKAPPSGNTTVDFAPFWTVWQKVQEDYYDKSKLDQQKMLTGAINGMIATLGDPFTVYLPPKQNNNFKENLSGEFQGIGAELGQKDNNIIVIAPIGGSPAEKAGVKAGDAILEVNDESTKGWTLPQAVEKIRGPKGTEVVLNILHKDQAKAEDIKIIRDTITVKSVTSWVKKIKDIGEVKISESNNEAIAYIRLSQFGDNTNKEWLSIVNDVSLKIKDQGAKGLILDLRNNPGGYLTDATYISSEFVNQGSTVVIQEEASGEKNIMKADRRGLLTDTPVVILINKGSASASEIVAGALRDNKKIKLIGETSFGKGTIQTAEDIGGGAGLHVTIAKWLTPNGTWVNGVGLKPDIEVSPDVKDPSHDTVLEKAIQELLK